MKICADFQEEETALEAWQALVDQGGTPHDIEVRSAYPLAESALPPHRSHPMLIRSWVRFLWVAGAALGFGFIAFTQTVWPIHTAGHPLVPLPIDFILTYECGMITGLIMSLAFLYVETARYRRLNPPPEEDHVIQEGNVAIIVHGALAEKAEKILQNKGAAKIVKLALVSLLFLPLLNGCAVKMRDQAYVKSTETSQIPKPPGALPMPSAKDRKENPAAAPLGYFYPPEMRMLDKKNLVMPAVYKTLKNPIPADAASVERGRFVFEHNCIFCHGPQGHGDGPVGHLFMPAPANLTGPDVRGDSDGELFYYITMGPATMPSFANRLTTRERFDVINYIRFLQTKG